MVSAPRCRPGARGLLTLLLLLLLLPLPGARGQCGTLPTLSRAVPRDTSRTEGFPIGTEVTYRCSDAFVKIPGKSDTVVCLSNSKWSTIGEFCNGKSCDVPKGPEHGRAVDITNNRYGARVNIICDEGFRLRGRPFIQCLLKGDKVEWSNLPTCQAIPCLPPPDITHGSHTGQSEQEFSFGSAVTYKCDQGFSLIGEASIHCTTKDHVNGEWSGPAPECKGLCGTLPRLSRAVPHDTSRTEGFPVGTEVTYRCLDGFVKIPGKSDTVVCLSNSEWSTIGEFCIGGCGATPRLKSAVLSVEDATKNYCPPGTTVSYVCRPGYEETELRPVITCLENSTWSEAPEFCRGKSCGVPKGPEHGRAVDTTNDLYGARVNIICDDGFRLRGRPFIQCTLKGDQVEWSQLPTCEGICDSPPRLSFAELPGVVNNSYPAGTQLKYSCCPGYVLRSGKSPVVTCLANSTWSVDPEFCVGTCDSPPRLSFAELPGAVNNSYPVGTKLKYSCRPGYVLGSGKSPVVTCLANSTWSVDPEFCVGRECKPLELENGRVHFTDLRFGATANFSCNEGYRLNGPTSAKCVVAGNGVDWDKELPLCEAIPCPPPPHITHGSHTGQTVQKFSFGSAVTYKCDQGFSLIGEASIHCTTKDNVNGEWSGPAPECKAITCSPPPNIANGMHNGSNVEIFDCNSSVTYKCDDNFSLTGEASIHCTTRDNINGVWNGSAPECKVIIIQDKPTTVPPKGTEVAGTSSEKQSTSDVCEMVPESREFPECGVPLEKLRTLLEMRKL